MKIILASGSPRRRELMCEIGLKFEIFKPDIDETRTNNEAPEDLCLRLSQLKAKAGAKVFPNSLVIAADTIVLINGEILGKPKNHDDAFRMLNTLQGKWHEVLTGLSVCFDGKIISEVEHTKVKFRELNKSEILSYISTGECDDKAGSYAIQGKGSLLIERIDGDYFNVVGLPVCRLGKILENFGSLQELLNQHTY